VIRTRRCRLLGRQVRRVDPAKATDVMMVAVVILMWPLVVFMAVILFGITIPAGLIGELVHCLAG
jgi:hypothetical protein